MRVVKFEESLSSPVELTFTVSSFVARFRVSNMNGIILGAYLHSVNICGSKLRDVCIHKNNENWHRTRKLLYSINICIYMYMYCRSGKILPAKWKPALIQQNKYNGMPAKQSPN